MKFLDSFFGLTHRFKIVVFSEVFQILTSPQWLSIYLKKDLGASDENIGLVNATQSGANVLLMPLGGAVGQKFSKKRLYLLGLVIQALAFLIAFLAEDWTWVILMSVILGCSALVGPGISALIGEVTDRATRATVFAFEATIISIVVMLRGPLQGFIAESAGLRPLYMVGVIGVMLSFFIFSKFFHEVGGDENKLKKQETQEQSEAKIPKNLKQQIRQVFARPDYRRNFVGLIQAGVLWRLFYIGLSPFIDIYLYDEIGWSFLFFGFYGFLSSFLTMVLRIPFGKIIDKYHLRRIFFFAGPVAWGFKFLLMVFLRDPYHVAAVFLVDSVIEGAHELAVGALWYDAIPLEVYSIGSAIRGVIYGVSSVAGSLLGAYLWANLGPTLSFYTIFTAEITRGFLALYLIRDIKDEK